jgi:hypothetical protein
LNNREVDAFIEMVEHGKKIYSEREVEEAMNRKQKHLGENLDSDILSNLRSTEYDLQTRMIAKLL